MEALDERRRERNLLDNTSSKKLLPKTKRPEIRKFSSKLESAVGTIKAHAKVAPHLRSHKPRRIEATLQIDPKKVAQDVNENHQQ